MVPHWTPNQVSGSRFRSNNGLFDLSATATTQPFILTMAAWRVAIVYSSVSY